MRICERAINSLQISDYEGTVRVCGWLHMPESGAVGSLKYDSLYDIWHGKPLRDLHTRLANDDYSLCNIDQCHFLAMGTIEDHKIELDELPEYPSQLWLAFERNCNYSCPCCHAPNWRERLTCDDVEPGYRNIEEKIRDILPHIKLLSANGLGELFASPHTLKILSEWQPIAPKEEVKVILETNGSLFNEKNWQKIANLGQYNLHVAITVMSLEEKTYQICHGTKLPITQIESNLRFIKKLREKEIINCLELATVVQERNFRTLPELTHRFIEEFGADIVRLRPFADTGAKSPEVEWFMDVRGAYHPYHQEFLEIMKDPIFKHPKVSDWSGGRDSEIGDLSTYLARKGCIVNGREQVNYDVVKILAGEENIEEQIEKYFISKKINKIALYGMGYPGRAFVKTIFGTKIEIDTMVDKSLVGESIRGMRVINISELPKDYDFPIVVTAPFYFDEIKQEIENRIEAPCILNIKDIIEEILRDIYC